MSLWCPSVVNSATLTITITTVPRIWLQGMNRLREEGDGPSFTNNFAYNDGDLIQGGVATRIGTHLMGLLAMSLFGWSHR